MRRPAEIRSLIQRLERWLRRRQARGVTNNSDITTTIVLLEEYESLLHDHPPVKLYLWKGEAS